MSMKLCVLAATVALALAQVALAGDFATAKEAQAMLTKAVAAIKANKQKTFEEITAQDPKWVDRDLYPYALDIQGMALAHGANAKLVGKNLGQLKDADGKLFVQGLIEQGRKGKGSVDYKWTEPVSKKVLSKRAFCESVDTVIVCTGIYLY